MRRGRGTLTARVNAYERALLSELIERHHGNVSAIAREAGRSRTEMYKVLKRHGLMIRDANRPRFESAMTLDICECCGAPVAKALIQPAEYGNEAWRALA